MSVVYHVIYGICSDVIITVNPRQNLVWSLWSSVYVDIKWQDRFIVILICRWSLLKDRKNFIVTRPQSPVIIYGILIGTYNTKPLEENKPRRLFSILHPSKKVLTEKNKKGTDFPENNCKKGNNSANNLRNTSVPEHRTNGCKREIFMKSSQWSFYISVGFMVFILNLTVLKLVTVGVVEADTEGLMTRGLQRSSLRSQLCNNDICGRCGKILSDVSYKRRCST